MGSRTRTSTMNAKEDQQKVLKDVLKKLDDNDKQNQEEESDRSKKIKALNNFAEFKNQFTNKQRIPMVRKKEYLDTTKTYNNVSLKRSSNANYNYQKNLFNTKF